ncbi:hypothetical protein EEL32_02525 [Brevibacillus laterosporus]|nr:hypothetical protein [Brevibacillus laterosporus]TPG91453.1 hypothetical protein EEL32_02525 [Brevibacillus laterosporus]
MDNAQLKRYVEQLSIEGKTEPEVITVLAKLTTQNNIAQILDVNVRRVKYLYKKYNIRKYNLYRKTRRCTHCKEEVHISCFEPVLEGNREGYKRVCYYCQKDYYRMIYRKRIVNKQWEQEHIKREIFTKMYEIEVLESLLN